MGRVKIKLDQCHEGLFHGRGLSETKLDHCVAATSVFGTGTSSVSAMLFFLS